MALITCTECGVAIVGDVPSCPKCGAQIPKAKRSPFGIFVKWLFILFNILMPVWILAGLYVYSAYPHSNTSYLDPRFGFILLIGMWVIGDVILGVFMLFTRPKVRSVSDAKQTTYILPLLP